VGNPAIRALTAAACLLAAPAMAEAACTTQPVRFNLPENQTITTYQTVAQDGCETGFGIGGDNRLLGASQAAFTEIRVMERAKNLTIAPLSNGFGYSITVKNGYRGPDRYTMRACGSNINGKGCVTITYIVTVQ
jgi:hypothetical protein